MPPRAPLSNLVLPSSVLSLPPISASGVQAQVLLAEILGAHFSRAISIAEMLPPYSTGVIASGMVTLQQYILLITIINVPKAESPISLAFTILLINGQLTVQILSHHLAAKQLHSFFQ